MFFSAADGLVADRDHVAGVAVEALDRFLEAIVLVGIDQADGAPVIPARMARLAIGDGGTEQGATDPDDGADGEPGVASVLGGGCGRSQGGARNQSDGQGSGDGLGEGLGIRSPMS